MIMIINVEKVAHSASDGLLYTFWGPDNGLLQYWKGKGKI